MRCEINRIEETDAGAEFNRLLDSDQGFFVGRIGGTDWDFVSYYYDEVYQKRRHSYESIQTTPSYAEHLSLVSAWNGFYDLRNRSDAGSRFCERLLKCYAAFDFTTVGHAKLLTTLGFLLEGQWGYDPESNDPFRLSLLGSVVNCSMCNYRYLEDMKSFLYEVFPLFAGKRVLVCSPFTYSFLHQRTIVQHLFTGEGFAYPEFELVTLTTPVTYSGTKRLPHHDWFQTSAALCAQVETLDFDIALLGCGSYALELGNHIKSLGKGALYMGGALQLYFGVMGRRYNEQPHYRQLINPYWITPFESPDIKVHEESTTEAWGAYW